MSEARRGRRARKPESVERVAKPEVGLHAVAKNLGRAAAKAESLAKKALDVLKR